MSARIWQPIFFSGGLPEGRVVQVARKIFSLSIEKWFKKISIWNEKMFFWKNLWKGSCKICSMEKNLLEIGYLFVAAHWWMVEQRLKRRPTHLESGGLNSVGFYITFQCNLKQQNYKIIFYKMSIIIMFITSTFLLSHIIKLWHMLLLTNIH